jgi:hypothetical protein
MAVCLTVRTPDGSTADLQFNTGPTTMRLRAEPHTSAATMRTFIQRRLTRESE